MEEPGKHFVTPAEALGGYFFILAMEPSPRFYNALRKAGCDAEAIRWNWFCIVHCFVDLAVQKHASISTKPSRIDWVLAALIKNTKEIGINSDDHLHDIEARSSLFRRFLENYLEANMGGSLLIGQAIAENLDCDSTNPASLFELGQEFLNFFAATHEKFEHFEIL